MFHRHAKKNQAVSSINLIGKNIFAHRKEPDISHIWDLCGDIATNKLIIEHIKKKINDQ